MKTVTNELVDDLLTLPEVARQLHVTLDQALALVEAHQLRAGRGRDGALYVRRSDADAYTATRTSQP